MTELLVSVRSVAEAILAMDAGADLIDAKDPDHGALGALAVSEIAAIKASIGDRKTVTAVIGDHLTQGDALIAATEIAATGVDIVKVGLFAEANPSRLATILGERLAQKTKLVAVLLADQEIDFGIVPLLARVGFRGVMMDTASKSAGLLAHRSLADLGDFIRLGQAHGLMTGLAGSLNLSHMGALKRLNPSLIGVRGGVCDALDRTSGLVTSKIIELAACLKASRPTERLS